MDPGPNWTRVVVDVSQAGAELVADLLWQFSPAAIEEQDSTDGSVLLAGFDDPLRAAAAAAAMGKLATVSVQVIPVTDDGLDGWRAWATVERSAPFVIVPTWLDPPPLSPGEHLLWIDPAHTFGSGSHPTTRLVLGCMASIVEPTTSVLDVGCGSGILGIGTALLGAAQVHGIDVDPGSPATTQSNARRNGVADTVQATTTPLAVLAATGQQYDLVLANLLAPVVIALAADLTNVVAPTGSLLISGLLSDRWEEATTSLRGLTVTDVVIDEGWAAVILRTADHS